MTTMTMNPAAAIPTVAFDGKDVQRRLKDIKFEMGSVLLEREALIHNMWVARIAQQHLIQIGPGGIAKSFSIELMCTHVVGDVYFEHPLDETTDPTQLYGPPNVKDIVEKGESTFNTEGMLPEATVAFLDEFFNGNTPVLHSLQPPLNERKFKNGRRIMRIPLRSAFMGTNWTNPDVAVAWLWDRIPIREMVDDLQDRANLEKMVDDAILRMAMAGHGAVTLPNQTRTTVSLDELDRAQVESLMLPVSPAANELFYDIRDEIQFGSAGVRISPRRLVQSKAAVKANAWLNGHDEVQSGDLDILASMWWTLQEQRSEVQKIILTSTNPGEKEAMDLLEQLDKIKRDVAEGIKPDTDRPAKVRVGTEAIVNLERLERDANAAVVQAQAAGLSTRRLDEVLAKANAMKADVGREAFGLAVSAQQNIARAGA